MSDKGGSDLDVFKSLTKSNQRNQTLVGVAVASVPSAPPPPPPPSLRASGIEEVDELSVEGDVEPELEVHSANINDIEELDAIGEGEFGFRDDESTNVFSLPLGSSPAAVPSPRENEYQYSEPAWSPAAPPYAPPAASRPTAQPFNAPIASSPGFATGPIAVPAPPSFSSTVAGLGSPQFPPFTSGGSMGLPASLAPGGVPLPPIPGGSSRPVTSAPPPPPPAPPQASVGDWDDEDDQTTVYSRSSGHMPPFGALNRHIPAPSVVPGAPPPPMSRPSAPIPMQPSLSIPLPRPASLPSDVLPPASNPPHSAPASRVGLYVGGGLALALLAALIYILIPKAGNLVVTVAGPGNKPIDNVEVLVDGKVVCQASPCTARDIAAGTHLVRARADGYQATADTAVPVTSGQDAVHNIKLEPAQATGVKVTGIGSDLRLWIDDKEIGSLPQEVTDLTPGTHHIKVISDAYQTHEQTVEVAESSITSIGPLKLKVIKGLARILPGENSSDARIVLETGGERKAIPRLPINLQIDTSKSHTLVASKPGFADYRKELRFDDGEAERTFEVSFTTIVDQSALVAASATPAPAPAVVAVASRPTSTPRPAVSPAPAAPKPAAAVGGGGTLNVNAIPKANVIVDGIPRGPTPKIGLSVSAGPHTVILVKDGQRVTKSVNVKAGQTSTVSHRW
jgi:hypothetical protein